MADLKPLGSEKLSADDKLKRILELTYYNEKKNKSISTKPELVKESTSGGVYGIVKEKDGYYVKRGLNEQTLDYIGGMFMKNKNRFSSYAEALKRLEFIKGQEELQEATKYVLKTNKPQEEAPMPEPAMDLPAPPPSDVPSEELPPAPESDVDSSEPAPEGGDDMTGELGSSEQGGESKRSDYMAEVQKFAGKLGQELRDQQDRMESDDIKYVLNMVISAVDLDKLEMEDLEEIGKKFEREEEIGGEVPAEEPTGDEGLPDEEPVPAEEPTGGDEELGEVDAISALESFVNTPIDMVGETDEIDLSNYADIEETKDEIKEVDLEEIKAEISQAISEKLSKYFN